MLIQNRAWMRGIIDGARGNGDADSMHGKCGVSEVRVAESNPTTGVEGTGGVPARHDQSLSTDRNRGLGISFLPAHAYESPAPASSRSLPSSAQQIVPTAKIATCPAARARTAKTGTTTTTPRRRRLQWKPPPPSGACSPPWTLTCLHGVPPRPQSRQPTDSSTRHARPSSHLRTPRLRP